MSCLIERNWQISTCLCCTKMFALPVLLNFDVTGCFLFLKLFIVVERKLSDFKVFILHYNLIVLLNSEVTGWFLFKMSSGPKFHLILVDMEFLVCGLRLWWLYQFNAFVLLNKSNALKVVAYLFFVKMEDISLSFYVVGQFCQVILILICLVFI